MGDAVSDNEHPDERPDELAEVLDLAAGLSDALIRAGLITCQWFALCGNDAVMRKANPLFPHGVPCCQRCSDKADRLSR